ncbi:hypothetical protein FHX44_113214 [Pseudonocardia hierapolitana]|uniref:Uncharacterized protein n=1 Tax=Pseudonocardia hierapolitana TaxID=1128676 RepID=A0A561SR21_9PSEU|nr:hypothetical protein FHX44_113214 [Pseudonocardia hierapolitana]
MAYLADLDEDEAGAEYGATELRCYPVIDKEGAAPTFKRGYGPALDVRRPRTGRHRGTAVGAAAPRQRRQQHRRRPHHRAARGPAPAPRTPHRHPARTQDPDPPRLLRRHPRPAGLDHRPAVVLLGRIHPARHRRHADRHAPRAGLADRQQRRRRTPRRRRGRRTHRTARPHALARGHAGDRAPRKTAPRRTAAPNRRRRQPTHRHRHQHPPGRDPAANSPTSNSATGAAFGPRTGSASPRTPGCATCPCTTCPEPDLVRPRRARLRDRHLGPDARLRRSHGPPVGTQAATAADLFRPRSTGALLARPCCTCPNTRPGHRS